MNGGAKKVVASGGSLLSVAILVGCASLFCSWSIDQWRALAPLLWEGERVTGAVTAMEAVHTRRKGKDVTRYTCTVAYRGWRGTFDARDRCDVGSAVQVVYAPDAPRNAILVPSMSSVPLAVLRSEDGGRAIVATLLAATTLAVLLVPWLFPGTRRRRRT